MEANLAFIFFPAESFRLFFAVRRCGGCDFAQQFEQRAHNERVLYSAGTQVLTKAVSSRASSIVSPAAWIFR